MPKKPIRVLYQEFLQKPVSDNESVLSAQVEALMQKYHFTDKERTIVSSYCSTCKKEAFSEGVKTIESKNSNAKTTLPLEKWQVEPKMILEHKFWQNIMCAKYPLDIVGKEKYIKCQLLAALMDNQCIANRQTAYVYEHYYFELCKKYGLKIPANDKEKENDKISFCKMVTHEFPITIVDIKRLGKKFRVFKETIFNLDDYVER